jgi:hypothetical protein
MQHSPKILLYVEITYSVRTYVLSYLPQTFAGGLAVFPVYFKRWRKTETSSRYTKRTCQVKSLITDFKTGRSIANLQIYIIVFWLEIKSFEPILHLTELASNVIASPRNCSKLNL